ncbi:hypothetical protein MCUN1_002010 [Malassezia cuniculi]|uniref:C2 domain-containing protein n=1 Tax=Malassezia cuniculi TaxID=948313 RepID=A0AAF0J6K8_9BASI|nr:hypothetical protein MCUN1_002010 [Malassezia cuniculi]
MQYNPYASISVGDTTLRTRADRRGGQHPHWDEQLNFEIYDNIQELLLTSVQDAPPPLPSKTLHIACFAEDRDTEMIGEGTLSLDTVLRDGEHDTWVPIFNRGRYAGEVYVELTFYSADPPPQMSTHRSLTDLPDVLRVTPDVSVYTPPYAPQSIIPDTSQSDRVAVPVRRHKPRAPAHTPLARSQSAHAGLAASAGIMQSFADLSIASSGADDSADWTSGPLGPEDSTDSIGAHMHQLPQDIAWAGRTHEITAQEAIYGTTSPIGRRPLPVASPAEQHASSARVPSASFVRHSIPSSARTVSMQGQRVVSGAVPAIPPNIPRAVSPGIIAHEPSPGLPRPVSPAIHRAVSPGVPYAASPAATGHHPMVRASSPAVLGTSPAHHITSPIHSTSPALAPSVAPTTPTGRRPLPSPGVSPAAAHTHTVSPEPTAHQLGMLGRAGAPHYV